MVPMNMNAVFYATTYHPIQAGSIDGTDTAPHDNAVYRALLASSTGLYDPTGDPKVEGDPYCSIFVGRLSSNTTETTLNEAMSKYGRIKRLRLVRDIVTGDSQGYAFVEYETEKEMRHAYEAAHQSMIDGSQVLVDYNRQQLMPGWIPRRLGGGLGGRKESGQLRFGGRDRPFRAPLRPIPHEELQKLGIPLPPQGRYLSRFQIPPLPRRQKEFPGASHSRHGSHFSQGLHKGDLISLEASVKTNSQPDYKFQNTSQRTENVTLVLDGALQAKKLSDADMVQSDLVHHEEDSNSKLSDDRKRHRSKHGKTTSLPDEDSQSMKSLETDRVQSDDLYHKEPICKEEDHRKRHRRRHGELEDIVLVLNESHRAQSYDVYYPNYEEIDARKRHISHGRAAAISPMHAEDMHSKKSLETGRVQSDDMCHKEDSSPKEVGDQRRHRSKEVDDRKMHRSKHRKRHREDKSDDDEHKRSPLHCRRYQSDETSYHQSRYKHHSEHTRRRRGHKEDDESHHELHKHRSENRKK